MDQDSFQQGFNKILPQNQHAMQEFLLKIYGEDGRERFNRQQEVLDGVLAKVIKNLLG